MLDYVTTTSVIAWIRKMTKKQHQIVEKVSRDCMMGPIPEGIGSKISDWVGQQKYAFDRGYARGESPYKAPATKAATEEPPAANQGSQPDMPKTDEPSAAQKAAGAGAPPDADAPAVAPADTPPVTPGDDTVAPPAMARDFSGIPEPIVADVLAFGAENGYDSNQLQQDILTGWNRGYVPEKVTNTETGETSYKWRERTTDEGGRAPATAKAEVGFSDSYIPKTFDDLYRLIS